MSRRRFPWDRLGIDATSDTGVIRRAYADALRATNVDEDIAGYAELRRARDEALWFAAQAQRDGEGDSEDDLGLGSLGEDEAAPDDDWLHDEDDGEWEDLPPSSYHDAPLAPAAPDRTRSEAQAKAEAAWQRLLATLYPDGEASEAVMTFAEMEEGLEALAILTARAEEADLAEHDAIDGALADLFSRTWPRSAPFVEPAAESFRWLEESGSIEERWALRFLNQRLKGMRFHEKVQQPDHPLHKAWAELSRTGPASFADRIRVKRVDVLKLLDGIRERYPELESHLDPQRVASWDNGRTAPGDPGIVPRIIRGLFIVLLVVGLPRLIGSWYEPGGEASSPPIMAPDSEGPSEAELDAAVAEIFGPGVGMKTVEAEDAAFARELRAAIARPEIARPLDLARMKALASAEVARRPTLEARTELKAMWLTAARARPDDTCRKLMDGNLRGLTLDLSKADRAREQVLLRELLVAKVLGHMPKGGEVRYAIPGWLVADTLRRSGLPEKRLVPAFQQTDHPDRCTAEAALVQAVRAGLAKVPDEVLRGL